MNKDKTALEEKVAVLTLVLFKSQMKKRFKSSTKAVNYLCLVAMLKRKKKKTVKRKIKRLS